MTTKGEFPDLGSAGGMEGLLDPDPPNAYREAVPVSRPKVRRPPPKLKVGQMDEADERRLAALYAKQPLLADHLAYTKEFEGILKRFNTRRSISLSHHQLFHHLVRIRKRGVLPRKARSTTGFGADQGQHRTVCGRSLRGKSQVYRS